MQAELAQAQEQARTSAAEYDQLNVMHEDLLVLLSTEVRHRSGAVNYCCCQLLGLTVCMWLRTLSVHAFACLQHESTNRYRQRLLALGEAVSEDELDVTEDGVDYEADDGSLPFDDGSLPFVDDA